MKNKASRGSTLGWVIVVMMVVMIWMMWALTMSASHINRYQRSHNRKQIHMTAVSVAEAIGEELESPGGEGSFGTIMEQMLEDSPEGEVSITGLDDRMGEVRLSYTFDGERLILTVQVQRGKESEETKLTMARGISRDGTESWDLLGYGLDEAAPGEEAGGLDVREEGEETLP